MWKNDNDIVEFSNEMNRMCAAHHACKGCPLEHDLNCLSVVSISPRKVKEIAQWVYDNPEPTAAQVIETDKLMADFMEYWGADIPIEEVKLYTDLINWLEDEISRESIAVKI